MPFKSSFLPSPCVTTNVLECHVFAIVVNDLFFTDHSTIEVSGKVFNGRKPASGVSAINDPLFGEV